MNRTTLLLLSAVGVAALVTAVPACGGGDQKVEYPKVEADGGGAVEAGSPVSTAGGQEVGVAGGPDAHADLSGSAKSAYDGAFQAWMKGDLQAAKKGFQEAASDDPKSPAPHYSLGCVMDRLGEYSSAQQEYRNAMSLKSDYELAMGGYAMSLAASGHPGEADTFLTDKRARMPNSPRVATYLAEVKSIEKDSGSAQQIAQDALRIDPDFKEAMVTIARDHYRARRLELAKYALQAILDGFGDVSPPRDKDNAEAHLLRGLIYKEQGNRAAAFKDFEAAVARRPDLVEALIQLGVMKLEAGNAGDATPLLESATRFAPKSALAHLNLGDAYRLGGRPTEAKREFDTALSMDSTLAVAHYDLGLMFLFSSNVPGMSASDQVQTAIKELTAYRTMRGPKPPPGQSDDVDELLQRANAKQNELKQAAAAPPPAAKPAAPAAKPATPAPAPAAPGAAPKPATSGGIVRDMP